MKKVILLLAISFITLTSCDKESMHEDFTIKSSSSAKAPFEFLTPGDSGNGGNNGSCVNSLFAVGDCNEGAFGGVYHFNCIPFSINGEYNGNNAFNLEMEFLGGNYISLVSYTNFYNLSTDEFWITVNYKEGTLVPNLNEPTTPPIVVYTLKTKLFIVNKCNNTFY